MSCQFSLKLAEEEESLDRTNGKNAEVFSYFAKSLFRYKPKPKIVSINTIKLLSLWEVLIG